MLRDPKPRAGRVLRVTERARDMPTSLSLAEGTGVHRGGPRLLGPTARLPRARSGPTCQPAAPTPVQRMGSPCLPGAQPGTRPLASFGKGRWHSGKPRCRGDVPTFSLRVGGLAGSPHGVAVGTDAFPRWAGLQDVAPPPTITPRPGARTRTTPPIPGGAAPLFPASPPPHCPWPGQTCPQPDESQWLGLSPMAPAWPV